MFTIDHVAFGGRDLDDLRAVAETVGLPTAYGGPHGTGTTHMAVVGLPDGTYLELLAPTEGTDPAEAGFWPAHLGADAGPAGWCLDVPDVAAAAKSAIDRGVRVDGPHEASRTLPDGTRVEWDMCFEGDDADERLPFLISDRTPRSYRTTPNPDLLDSPLVGTAAVVLAVDDADASADLLAGRHRLPTPVDAAGPFDRLRVCPGVPVALAEADGAGELRERIETVGEGPCAYLLGADDFEAARERFSLGEAFAFGRDGARRAAWFDHERFAGRLGVVSL